MIHVPVGSGRVKADEPVDGAIKEGVVVIWKEITIKR